MPKQVHLQIINLLALCLAIDRKWTLSVNSDISFRGLAAEGDLKGKISFFCIPVYPMTNTLVGYCYSCPLVLSQINIYDHSQHSLMSWIYWCKSKFPLNLWWQPARLWNSTLPSLLICSCSWDLKRQKTSKGAYKGHVRGYETSDWPSLAVGIQYGQRHKFLFYWLAKRFGDTRWINFLHSAEITAVIFSQSSVKGQRLNGWKMF